MTRTAQVSCATSQDGQANVEEAKFFDFDLTYAGSHDCTAKPRALTEDYRLATQSCFDL